MADERTFIVTVDTTDPDLDVSQAANRKADCLMADAALRGRVLDIALRYRVDEPNAEAGFERLRALGCAGEDAGLAAAVAACVHEGTLADPVFLADGALQCRWRLVPTPTTAEG